MDYFFDVIKISVIGISVIGFFCSYAEMARILYTIKTLPQLPTSVSDLPAMEMNTLTLLIGITTGVYVLNKFILPATVWAHTTNPTPIFHITNPTPIFYDALGTPQASYYEHFIWDYDYLIYPAVILSIVLICSLLAYYLRPVD